MEFKLIKSRRTRGSELTEADEAEEVGVPLLVLGEGPFARHCAH